jgi:regulatory protein
MTAPSGGPGRRISASRGSRPDRLGRGGRDFARGRGRPAEPVDTDLDTDGETPGSLEDDPGDPESVARSICLSALTGTPKTRQQLADLLARKGVPEHAATVVLDRFGEVGLIDDAAFARLWVSSRQAGRGLARRALQAELRAKGVDAEVAAAAVEAVDDDDERTAARQLVERRARSMQRLDRATATRRLVGMLARKGYGGGLAAAVVREVLDAAGAEHGDDEYEPL